MKKLLYLFSLLTIFSLTACQEEVSKEDHPLIYTYTNGERPSTLPIVVSFTADAVMLDSVEIGSELKPGLITISDNPEGTYRWAANKVIEFTPSQPLEGGKTYRVVVHMNKIVEVGDTPKKFIFEFTISLPNYSAHLSPISMYDNSDEDIYYIEGTIVTSTPIDNAKAEQMAAIVSKTGGTIKWDHNPNNLVHNFTIDSLEAKDSAYEVEVAFTGKPINCDNEFSEKKSIPQKGVFKLEATEVLYDPDFSLELTFSKRLDPGQSVADFISLSGGDKLRFKTESNKVSIFFPSRIIGNRELTINGGLASSKGIKLGADTIKTITFQDLKPAVKFARSGSILPTSTELKMPFSAVGYQTIRVTVTRIFQNNILQFLQINSLNGGEREIERVGNQVVSKVITLGKEGDKSLQLWNTYSLDLKSIVDAEPGAVYRIELEGLKEIESDNPQQDSEDEENRNGYRLYDYDNYYNSYRERTCNILVSDIAIMAKCGSSKAIDIFVSNLLTAQPIGGANIKIYNYTNQIIAEGKSSTDGYAQITPKSGQPHLIVVEHQGQQNYLKLASYGILSTSEFDVSGVSNNKSSLKGYIYGERGVWRPSDKIYLSFILQDKDNTLPANHPVVLHFYNPKGQEIATQKKSMATDGLYCFELSTAASDITGTYRVSIDAGGSTFKKDIRIETIKPNRLKIALNLNEKPILNAKDIEGTLEAKWLHGADAKGLNARVLMTLRNTNANFKGFEGYSFSDLTKKLSNNTEKEIFRGNLSDEGTTSFSYSISNNNSIPGMLSAEFTTRVYEPTGEFSTDSYTTPCTFYQNYVGFLVPKSPDNQYNTLSTSKKYTFPVATLSAEGKAISSKNIKVEISTMDYVWWWDSQNGSSASFNSSDIGQSVFSTTISTLNGKGSFNYTWGSNDYGLYLIKVTDLEGGHSSSQICNVSWGDSSEGGLSNSGATMLSIKSDKQTYTVGDVATITVPSSADSKILISLESASKILSWQWHNTKAGNTTISIPITKEMAPNIYVNATLIQPYGAVHNDAPMRLYGVIPLMVENPESKLNPTIEAPKTIKPQQPFEIKIKENSGKPMSYTLAIVDDGLLGLTRFKTPNAWGDFFAREALGVQSWDIYNDVIGGYGGRIEQLFSIGGDGSISNTSAVSAQRFKPVATFMGPFTLKAGGKNSHTVELPAYIGQVRVMVVASSKSEAFGSAECNVEVKKPVMVSLTLPRVVSTDEEILVPVTVFAIEPSVKNVAVSLSEFKGFEVVGKSQQSVTFSAKGEKIVYFKLKAKGTSGPGRIKVVATASSDSATETIDIEVRNPAVKQTASTSKSIAKGDSFNGQVALIGIAGTNSLSIELSTTPPLNLSERLGYLLSYPHGCIEQISSTAFPQLYIPRVVELSPQEVLRAENNVKNVLNRMANYQRRAGNFSYWPNSDYSNDWANVYAGHFMVEAKKTGYSVSDNMYSNWLNNMYSSVSKWSPQDGNANMQAYGMYVLALAGKPERGAMNRLKEYGNLNNITRILLSGAYALDGKKEIAKQLISAPNASATTKDSWYSDNFSSPERDLAITALVYQTLNDATQAQPLLIELSKRLNSKQWLSTQSTAWALMAITNSLPTNSASSGLNYNYTVGASKGAVNSKKQANKLDFEQAKKTGSIPITIKNNGESNLYMQITSEGIPAKGQEVERADNLTLSVNYFSVNGNTRISLDSIEQGTDYIAISTIHNPGKMGGYTNMVFSQLAPSGCEILEAKVQSGTINYFDIRDDRVYYYFNLGANSTITFATKFTATYSGHFYLPSAVCEAMYDGSVFASTMGKWCTITQPK